jgi:flagellar protein FliL
VKNEEKPMSEDTDTAAVAPQKRSKKPLLLGIGGALILGGAGFYAAFTGLLFPPPEAATKEAMQSASAMQDVAFVPIDPVIVTLGEGSENKHLKFTAQVEVETAHVAEVTRLVPRILDVFNSYLTAVEPVSLEGNAAIVRVRAQLLRRIQVVVGEGRVRDLLITEFVLN